MAETEKKTEEADGIVRKYMLGALGVGIVPIPLADVALLTGIQLKMLHRLAQLYEVEFSEQRSKSIIAALVGGGVPVSFSRFLLPFGHLITMASVSVFGGASTYAIGKVFIQHFESGGTFLTFDPQQVKDYYAQQVEQGKKEVRKSFAGIKP